MKDGLDVRRPSTEGGLEGAEAANWIRISPSSKPMSSWLPVRSNVKAPLGAAGRDARQ
jgi:hypothetical protein